MASPFATHEVFNQSPPFGDVNLFESDAPLAEAVRREGAAAAVPGLTEFGAGCGSAEAFELGRLANENPPRLRTFDAKGHRLDIVEFHPAYHELMARSMAAGLHCSTWEHFPPPLWGRVGEGGTAGALPSGLPPPPAPPHEGEGSRPGANVARAAGSYMAAQMEAGHCCPITMTHAAVPTLRLAPAIAAEWLPRVLSRAYDRRFLPASQKAAVTIGMGMTEKQGGTDVRANTTRAEPTGAAGSGAPYAITGHKWFMSAPMCDAFLVLAQAPGGLSCFFMPRFLPDGSVNAIRLQRLKDKLGNRSNASSEVEFSGALAWLVGEEGRGVPAILEMVTTTRLDCAVSSAGLMRLGLANAVHHARHRTVFQKKLVDQPLMRHVLADLALDVEAATALAFRLAASFDQSGDPAMAAWRRVMTPVTKYWVCKLAPAHVYEAMECLGGNGYVEDGLAARLYREVPVNAIWEGSGNVMALDLLRVLAREPDAVQRVVATIADASRGDSRLEAAIARWQDMAREPAPLEARARTLAAALAEIAAGALLLANAPPTVADAFIATRLAGRASSYGQGLERADVGAIIGRVLPEP